MQVANWYSSVEHILPGVEQVRVYYYNHLPHSHTALSHSQSAETHWGLRKRVSVCVYVCVKGRERGKESKVGGEDTRRVKQRTSSTTLLSSLSTHHRWYSSTLCFSFSPIDRAIQRPSTILPAVAGTFIEIYTRTHIDKFEHRHHRTLPHPDTFLSNSAASMHGSV